MARVPIYQGASLGPELTLALTLPSAAERQAVLCHRKTPGSGAWATPLTSYVVLGKSLNVSDPQVFLLKTGEKNTYLLD